MRLAAMVVAAAVTVAIGGCVTAAEKKRVEQEDKISAARLGGKFRHDDPIVQMLSADERGALANAGMLEPREEGADELGDGSGDGEQADADADKSGMDKAGDVMVAVLAVVVPLGMAVAPYLLF
jgi:hypothetical protein